MLAQKVQLVALAGLLLLGGHVLQAEEVSPAIQSKSDLPPTLAEIAQANDAAWAAIKSVDMTFDEFTTIVDGGKKLHEFQSTDLRWTKAGNQERESGLFRTLDCGSGKDGKSKITDSLSFRDYYCNDKEEWCFSDRDPNNTNRKPLSPLTQRGINARIDSRNPEKPSSVFHSHWFLRYLDCANVFAPKALSQVIAAWKVAIKEKQISKTGDTLWVLHAEYPSKNPTDKRAGSYMDITVNADKGFWVQKIFVCETQGGFDKNNKPVDTYYTQEVVDFQDFGQGVYFPKFLEKRLIGAKDRLDTEDGWYVTTTINELSINSQIPEGAFDFRFPENVVVHKTLPDKTTKILIWGPDNKSIQEFASELEYAKFVQQAEYGKLREKVESKQGSKAPEDLMERCGYYCETKEFDKAIDTCSELIALAPNSQHASLAYSGRGMIYVLNKRDFEKAISDFTASLAWQPPSDCEEEFDNCAVYFFRGLAHANLENHLDQALTDLTKALEGEKCFIATERGPHLLRSAIYLQKGELAKALADADDAVKIDPQSADALLLRSQIHEKQGRPDKAAADRKACQKIEKTPMIEEGLEVEMQTAVHTCLMRLVPGLERR